MDIAIPVVFPDYLIAVDTPGATIELPDLNPRDKKPGRKIKIPAQKMKLPDLGHAGILLVRGADGTTKYYEYGRYDSAALGLVRKRNVPNVRIGKNGRPTRLSLTKTFVSISKTAGQAGRIRGAYIEVENKYQISLDYILEREAQNRNPKRESYDLLSNSCVHFMKNTLSAAGIAVPLMLDPRPVSYIEELQEDYPPVEYDPKAESLTVDGVELE